jgi:hypothetical protein
VPERRLGSGLRPCFGRSVWRGAGDLSEQLVADEDAPGAAGVHHADMDTLPGTNNSAVTVVLPS